MQPWYYVSQPLSLLRYVVLMVPHWSQVLTSLPGNDSLPTLVRRPYRVRPELTGLPDRQLIGPLRPWESRTCPCKGYRDGGGPKGNGNKSYGARARSLTREVAPCSGSGTAGRRPVLALA